MDNLAMYLFLTFWKCTALREPAGFTNGAVYGISYYTVMVRPLRIFRLRPVFVNCVRMTNMSMV